MPALRLLSWPSIVSGPIPMVRERPIEREDDLSLFFWLVRELEPLEARPEAGQHTDPEAAERRASADDRRPPTPRLSEDEVNEEIAERLGPADEAEQDEESKGDKSHDEPPDILAS